MINTTATSRRRAEPLQQLEDLRLHRHIEGGGWLIGENQGRLAGERHGDHDALAHATAALMRILPQAAAPDQECPPCASSSMARCRACPAVMPR